MEYQKDCPNTQRALNLCKANMNKHDIESPEYLLAQKCFRYIADRVRINQKLNEPAK